MKKTLGALVLTLSALVITAACASTSGPSKPTPQQPDAGETWSKAGPERTTRPVTAAAVPPARLAE